MKTMERTSALKESTVRQILDLAAFVASVLARLSFEAVQYWLKNKTLLRQKLMEVFEIPADTYAEARAEWTKFYKVHFGMDVDFSTTPVPEKPTYPCRLEGIAKGLTLNKVLAVMRAKFKVILYAYGEDLDAVVTTNTRTTVKSYFIWVRDGVEPDESYLGKSTWEADMDGKIGMTLLERLILELKFFVETTRHLDIKGGTICTGSRDSDDRVPFVHFDRADDEVEVHRYDVDDLNPSYGLRQAVSL